MAGTTARRTLSVNHVRRSVGVVLSISSNMPGGTVQLTKSSRSSFHRKRGQHAGDQADERTGGDYQPPEHPAVSINTRPAGDHPAPAGRRGVGAEPPAHGALAVPRAGRDRQTPVCGAPPRFPGRGDAEPDGSGSETRAAEGG